MTTPTRGRSKYDIIRGRMDHEDELITSRLSWLITSQSFLFGAYAVLFRSGGTQPMGSERPLLMRLIPVVGIFGGVLIYLAIVAGVSALMHNRILMRKHLAIIQSLDPEFPPVQGIRAMAWLAMVAPLLLPVVLVAVWCVLLWELR
jgi:hypothetical protein